VSTITVCGPLQIIKKIMSFICYAFDSCFNAGARNQMSKNKTETCLAFTLGPASLIIAAGLLIASLLNLRQGRIKAYNDAVINWNKNIESDFKAASFSYSTIAKNSSTADLIRVDSSLASMKGIETHDKLNDYPVYGETFLPYNGFKFVSVEPVLSFKRFDSSSFPFGGNSFQTIVNHVSSGSIALDETFSYFVTSEIPIACSQAEIDEISSQANASRICLAKKCEAQNGYWDSLSSSSGSCHSVLNTLYSLCGKVFLEDSKYKPNLDG